MSARFDGTRLQQLYEAVIARIAGGCAARLSPNCKTELPHVSTWSNTIHEHCFFLYSGRFFWPACSPQLVPLIVFVWGSSPMSTCLLCETAVELEDDLLTIQSACDRHLVFFYRVQQSTVCRCGLCNEVFGRRFEQLLSVIALVALKCLFIIAMCQWYLCTVIFL